MKTVYKYRLQPEDEQLLHLPADARFLHVAQQGEYNSDIFAWVLLDPTAPTVERRIRIYGTGHEIPDSIYLAFLGTLQMNSGLVWHVFEEY